MPETTAIICARGGSKGIPRKNLKNFNGKPLLYWSVNAALGSKNIDSVVISSDDSEILEFSTSLGAITHKRPLALAQDDSTTESAVLDVLSNNENLANSERIVLIQATSPLTTSEDLDKAIDLFSFSNYESMLSVVKSHHFLWKCEDDGLAIPVNYDPKNRPMRQQVSEYFRENGAFYVTNREIWDIHKCRLGGRVGIYLMDDRHSVELDTEIDWKTLENLVPK